MTTSMHPHSGMIALSDLVTVPGHWIEQDGATVRFRLGPAPFWGPVHVHQLSSPAVADLFVQALRRMDRPGETMALDPVEWAAWQGESGGGALP